MRTTSFSMSRLLLCLLLVWPLCTCGAIQQSLQDQANPRHHPFQTYGAGAG